MLSIDLERGSPVNNVKTKYMISVLTTMMTIKQGKQSKGFEKGNYKCIRMDAHAIKSSDTPKWWDHSQTSKKYSKRS